MSRSRRQIHGSVWAVLVGCIVAVAPVQAERRVLEVVGAVPMHDAAGGSSVPKEAAIDQALWEGVSRVALELLLEQQDEVMPESDSEERLQAALGNAMVPYLRGFRIVEDQGERPVLFTDHPDAATEYVVVVAVEVETERIRERLVQTGLLRDAVVGEVRGFELEVLGLDHYSAYQVLRELLETDSVAVTSVTPREMRSDRVLLELQVQFGPDELIERMKAAAPAGLSIRAISPKVAGLAEGAGPRTPPSASLPSVQADTDADAVDGLAPARVIVELVWQPVLPPAEDPPAADAGERG